MDTTEADNGADQRSSDEKGGSSEFVITLFHGMGLQSRYSTLDELVQFLIRSLCHDPAKVVEEGTSIRISTHTHRERRDRDVVLSLNAGQLHPELAARLGKRKLTIRSSEVYWAPITSGAAAAWKTIVWLLGGLTSVVRAFVTMQGWHRPDAKQHREATLARGKSRSASTVGKYFGQMDSLADVWRLFTLLTRLAVVIIVLPLLVMAGSGLVVGWLAGWSVHLASRLKAIVAINDWWEKAQLSLHDIVANPWQLGDSPLLAMPHWLSMLAVLLPVLVYYIGTNVLTNSVNTPHSGNDPERNRQHRSLRLPFFTAFLVLLAGTYLLITGACHQHWEVLTEAMRQSSGELHLPRMHAWAYAALSLPLLSLIVLISMMGLRILRTGCSMQRLLGYGLGLLLISLAFQGWLTSDTAGAALAVMLILLGTWIALIRRGLLFIREYLGDVAAFVSTNENDQLFRLRRQILQFSEEKLEQVLGDDLLPNPLVDQYEASEDVRRRAPAVIVMAHSLGTVVAYQALCRYFERLHELDRIAQLNYKAKYPKAGNRPPPPRWRSAILQTRLKLFVTFGCPLDTIGLAFNAQHSGKPVFDRVVSNARYRHGSPGVFKHCEWLNWWHRGDVVSAKVLAHAGERLPQNRQFALPAPWIVNHSAYLRSRQVQADFLREFEKLL
jgi:hypothetical protein